MAEFLPICDLLFNVISLTIYFCNLVFDLVMSYALLDRRKSWFFSTTFTTIAFTSVLLQIVSLRWYLKANKYRTTDDIVKQKPYALDEFCPKPQPNRKPKWFWFIVLLHSLQLGVIWRYARLLVPVHVQFVKYDVRDLCLLRMVHGFCQSMPMLLFQSYLVLKTNTNQNDINNQKFLKLIRISIGLSLVSISWSLASFSKNVRLHKVHKLILTWLGVIIQFLWRLGMVSSRILALVNYAVVYSYWIFLVLFLHWLLTFLWLLTPKNVFHDENMSIQKKCSLCAIIAFVMVIDYINLQEVHHRQKMVIFYFVMFLENILLTTACTVGSVAYSVSLIFNFIALFATGLTFMLIYYSCFHIRRLKCVNDNNGDKNDFLNYGKDSKFNQSPMHGVFNCRFSNPSFSRKRKKKKPTSFVPPPANNEQPVPFWRQPLPQVQNGSSENEGNSSVGSRVNIYQKLQEKKQKQLDELKVIEEEIKQGKLARDASVTNTSYMLLPIPQQKLHNTSHLHHYYNYEDDHHNADYDCHEYVEPQPEHADFHDRNMMKFDKIMLTKRDNQLTPEVLLSPHYFNNRRIYSKNDSEYHLNDDDYFEIVSDIDSQYSLSRSYTLPREFRCYKKRKMVQNAMPSTNSSSDGDIESDDTISQSQPYNNVSNKMSNNNVRKKFRRLNSRNFQKSHPIKRETKL